ncbi:MAG: hypothetical protein AAF551_07625 [Bacteroidota bacterium]
MTPMFEETERYLNGEMSQEELTRFEAKVKENEEARLKVEKYRLMIEALKADERSKLKQELKKHLHVVPDQNHHKKWWRRAGGIAASLMFLVVCYWQFFYISPPSSMEVFERYYAPFPGKAMVRGEDEPDTLLQAYHAGKYAYVVRSIQQYTQDTVFNGFDLMAICSFIELDSIKQAREIYDRSKEVEDSLFRSHASWYMAMAYLKMDNTQEAVRILNDLVEGDSMYKRIAENVKNELRID